MRRAAARSQCANNLKQITLALQNYADTNPGKEGTTEFPLYPPGTVPNPDLPPERRLSWQAAVMPFFEGDQLYKTFDRGAPWDDPANTAAAAPFRPISCPDWDREFSPGSTGITPYLGVAGIGPDAALLPADDRRAGVFGYDRRTPLSGIKDGASNTVMILESTRDNGPWARGGPATVRGLDSIDAPYLGAGRAFSGTHFSENSLFGHAKPIGSNAAMADGSVRFLADTLAPQFLEALVTVAGGEELGDGW